MTIRKPSLWFRMLVLAAQGVFYNFFCTSQLPVPTMPLVCSPTTFQSSATSSPRVFAIALWAIWKRRLS